MWEDPIVAEVHRIRAELAARFDFDVTAMFADMRERQAALGPRLVSLAKSAEPVYGSNCQEAWRKRGDPEVPG
jgi:hypothetical protein